MKPALPAENMLFLAGSRQPLGRRGAILCLLIAASAALAACSGGSSQPVAAAAQVCNGSAQTAQASSGSGGGIAAAGGRETGAPRKILAVPGSAHAVVALFPDGIAYYSPDGFNLGGGGLTVAAYNGSLQVLDIIALSTGIDALLSDGTAFLSPDGQNLGGGGATLSAFAGSQKIASLTQVGSGVDAVLANGGGVYYSPDGINLTGCGSTRIYAGTGNVVQIIAVGPGDAVVTLFDDGSAFYSANNRDIGGGGTTVSATPGASAAVKRLIKVGGGVLAQLNDGAVYLSPDGNNLAGGAQTVRVSLWDNSLPNGPFEPRDSAPGIEFLGHLWLSGGFANPEYANSCFATCSFFDLWSSTDADGAAWNTVPSFATATAPDPRDVTPVGNDEPKPTDFYDPYSPIVVSQGQMLAIGATVWHSADGVTWARQNLADGVTAAPGPVPVRANENSRAMMLGASLFYLQPDIGQVYRAANLNGTGWSVVGPIPNFTARCGAAAFVMQGRIWIEGGGACDYSHVFNDMWSSADGIHWTHSATPAAWSARMWPCIAPGGDEIAWLVGGYAPTDWINTGGLVVPRYGANHADVWYSKDGANWQQFKADIGSGLPDDGALEARHAATCYKAPGNTASTSILVVMAGTGGTDPNDANARVINSIRTLPLPATTAIP